MIIIWSLSKKTTKMDLNKLSYSEAFWKLKFKIEKYKILNSESENIQAEYKLPKTEIKKVNDECDQCVSCNDTFKMAIIFCLAYQSLVGWFVGWLVRWLFYDVSTLFGSFNAELNFKQFSLV